MQGLFKIKPGFSPAYLDALFAPGDYQNLLELSRLLCGSPAFHSSTEDYGLELPLFVFVESLSWFAHALRSGAVTYFESSPLARQCRMHEALQLLAPMGFADQYAWGMARSRDLSAMIQMDAWMDANDDENNQWLWHLIEENREQWMRAVT